MSYAPPNHKWPPDDWPDFLEVLRTRPGMYTGARSARVLNAFVGGIFIAEHLYEVPEEKRLAGFDFAAFEEWVARTIDDRTWGSFQKAEAHAGSEEAGFDLWYNWYDEFRAATSTAQSHRST